MEPLDKKDRFPPVPNIEPEGTSDTERIQRWRWILDQNVPIIGGWMHRRITTALTESALTGNWLAAQTLAVVYVAHQEAEVRRMAGQTLEKINYSTGIDAVWGVWVETRHPGLEKIAVSYNRVANQPASVRLLSALRLNSLNTVTHGSADLIPALLRAWDDHDPTIAERARTTMVSLHNQSSIDALCSAWLDNRYPFLGDMIEKAGFVAQKPPAVRVLSALKVNQLDVVTHGTSDMVAPLVAASQYTDPQIAQRAKYCLVQLQQQAAVDELCKLWSETRSPMLEEIIIQAAYKARSPSKVRLLVALKTSNLTTAEKVDPHGLPHLLDATQDQDEVIRANAKITLGRLKNEETRDAICMMVIEKNDPQAREIALAHGYTPRAPEMRALFLFITGQWSAYDSLDFDQSMMRAIYEASSQELRQQIAAGVQAAGKTDYLTILAGVDFRSRAVQVNPNEASLMIRILAGNGEYKRLWNLITELALPFCIEIMRILVQKGWHPENEIDFPVFQQLAAILQQPILLDGPEFNRMLPVAIPRANLKVKGRVNDVAFSPTQPVLAIATSQRKVVLWNFQTASVEKILDGFHHSVGKVSYTPQGLLIAAERTSAQAPCAVYVFDGQESYQLGEHLGTVTAVEPLGETNLLTTGRDSQVILWDLAGRRAVKNKEMPFWVRSVAISPDQEYAALLHDRLNLVRLPELTTVPGYAFLPPRTNGFKIGVAQHAAFSPDGKYLLAGQYNGQVGMYYHTSVTQRPRKVLVNQHTQPVRGIQFLPDHPIVISAGAEGQIRFINWPDLVVKGTTYTPEGHLTSLRTSTKGSFMATGTNDAALILWDLRVLDIPDLFTLPLATANHDQVSNTLALSDYHSLYEPIRNALKFLRVLLQYRFRFDIHIDEAPIIRYGEFDIILEEA